MSAQKTSLQWMPSDLDLPWGTSLDECKSRYGEYITSSSSFQLSLWLPNQEQPIELVFDDVYQLERIQVTLAVSRDFWDNISTEEYRATATKFQQFYREKLAEYQSVLGIPDFQGDWDSPGYPDTEIASPLVYWTQGESRIQLEYDHQDKELPIFIRITAVRQ